MGEVTRCPVCTEGNNVNEMAEVKAIRAYIALADANGTNGTKEGVE